MNLFAWQKSCLESWRNHGTHGIISVVTGAGKTVFALAAAEELLKQYTNAVRIRIIVPTTALLRQWKKEILTYFPDLPEEEIGVYYASAKSDPDRLFMIYVVNSARYAVSRHILDGMREKKHQLLICDECHRYTGESNRLIFAFKDHTDFQDGLYHSLGMSATPRNALYEEVLVPALGSEIYHYGTSEARRDDHIAPLALIHVSVPLKPSELREYTDLERKIRRLHRELLRQYPELKGKSINSLFRYLSAFIEEDPEGLPALYCKLILKRMEIVLLASCRIDCTIDLLQRMNRCDRAIIFCDRITQAEKIYDIALHTLHLKAGHYHSEMAPEMRKIQLESFRSGELRMLVTCKALDEGLNVPDAAVGIVVSSSKNERQRIQRLGRILRKNKDKKAVLYYLHTNMPADRLQYLNELAEDTTTADMEYLPGEHDFYCDAYVARAEYLRNQNAFSKSKASEFMRCINEGNGKADWLLSEELYQKYIQNAETRKERNYWMVMQWLSKADPSSV